MRLVKLLSNPGYPLSGASVRSAHRGMPAAVCLSGKRVRVAAIDGTESQAPVALDPDFQTTTRSVRFLREAKVLT